jgi:hypothetical protein
MTFKDGLIVHKELFFGASLASSARHVASIARYLFMRRSGHHQMGFPGECGEIMPGFSSTIPQECSLMEGKI